MSTLLDSNFEVLNRFSIVVLTWNRPEKIQESLVKLRGLAQLGAEIIVVDNGSSPPVGKTLSADFSFAKILRIPENMGTCSRNAGLRAASGDFVVCLDDDVYGLTPADLVSAYETFQEESAIAAICFRVLDEKDPKKQINWCHDYELDKFCNEEFVTDEISEGAVAFRSCIISSLDMFPKEYFISHEGVAVAYQIMNLGHQVIYSPKIAVIHATAPEARTSWRRYYFDTRNNLWLVSQYFPVIRGMHRLAIEWSAMCLYSLRDGFFRYWLKGVFDGLRGLPRALRQRQPVSGNTLDILRTIDKNRPSLLHKIKSRLRNSEVRI